MNTDVEWHMFMCVTVHTNYLWCLQLYTDHLDAIKDLHPIMVTLIVVFVFLTSLHITVGCYRFHEGTITSPMICYL